MRDSLVKFLQDNDPSTMMGASNWNKKCYLVLPTKRRHYMDVNPEGIEGGDIISTRYGIARCEWVDEAKGNLAYRALNEVDRVIPEDNMPIRQTHLIAKFKNDGQLEFPFVQEMIEKVILERNEELEAMKLRVMTKVAPKGKVLKSEAKKNEEKAFKELIKKAGGIEALMAELKK